MSKRKPYVPKRPNRPTLIEVHQAFAMIDNWMTALKTGEIDFIVHEGREVPAFRDESGAYMPMLDGMRGWIECWGDFATGFGFHLDQQPLSLVLDKLEHGYPIYAPEVLAAEQTVARQRQIYRTLDPYKVRTISAACAERIRQDDTQLEQVAA